jgi:DNA polymerase sigma
VYDKLHHEILDFRKDTKAIMAEMGIIKTQIIDKLKEVITLAIPESSVDIYGSHATQLSLHWSDIDLVLNPPNGSDNPDNWASPLRTIFTALSSEANKCWV